MLHNTASIVGAAIFLYSTIFLYSKGKRMRVCAITKVFNEHFNLPLWLNHYGRQVGFSNCIIVDHGSNDGSTADTKGASLVRLPRSEVNQVKRVEMISSFVQSLLCYYDAVIYSDCDELLVADPDKYKSLVEFCSSLSEPSATAIGLNVFHHLGLENPIDPGLPILGQRTLVQFVSPMCKTLITKVPIKWGRGFHSSSEPIRFSDLFLFHLRWVDLGNCLQRLATTRQLTVADDRAGRHQRAEYLDVVKVFQDLATRKVFDGFNLQPYCDSVLSCVEKTNDGLFVLKGDIRSPGLLEIPRRFHEIL